MAGDFVIIIVVLILGVLAFLVGLAHAIWSAVCFVFGSVFGRRRGRGGGSGEKRRFGAGGLVCPREHCRKVEYRSAEFCSQCGAPLVERKT